MGREQAIGRGLARARVAALLLIVALAAGCGGGDDADDQPTAGSESTAEGSTTATGTPACSEARHSVVIDFAGFITDGDETDMWAEWLDEAEPLEPTPRPGTVELTQAYRQRGYMIVYVTTMPAGITIGGVPVPDAAQDWLQRQGYAVDDGTRVIGYQGTNAEGSDAVVSITTELARLHTAEGLAHDAGYTDNLDKARAMTAGSVPVQRLYMIGEDAGAEGTAAIPNADVPSHVIQLVEPLPPVCTPG